MVYRLLQSVDTLGLIYDMIHNNTSDGKEELKLAENF